MKVTKTASDDINIHRSHNYLKENLGLIDNPKNLYALNQNSSLISERRSSMRSISSHGSGNTYNNMMQTSPSIGSSSLKYLNHNTGSGGIISLNNDKMEVHDFDFHQQNDPNLLAFHQRSNQQILINDRNINSLNISTDVMSMNGREYVTQFSPSHYHQKFVHHRVSPQLNEPKYPPKSPSVYQHVNEQPTINTIHKDYYQEEVRTKQLQRAQTISNHHSPNHYTPSHSQGLGGYWTISNENNQRIWVPDNKYPISPLLQQVQTNNKMSKKSNSLGNFDFMHKQQEQQQQQQQQQHERFIDNNLHSSKPSEQQKKQKTWYETSLDDLSVETKYESRPRHRNNVVDETLVNNSNNSNNNIYELPHPVQPSITNALKIQTEGIYLNPLANNNNLPSPPVIPPKSKLRHTDSTKSVTSVSSVNLDIENNVIPFMSTMQMESPNSSKFTVIQEGSWKPYKEEVKSYEISDFYKYSLKYQQQRQQQEEQLK